jgi:hypothetical protein
MAQLPISAAPSLTPLQPVQAISFLVRRRKSRD